MRPRTFIAAAATAALAGCAAPVRTLTFEVTHASDGRPAEGVLLRAIPLGSSPVPLPLSLRTFEQFQYAIDAANISDKNGRIRVELHNSSAHQIEINAPAVSEGAEQGPWGWILDAGGRELTPIALRADSSERLYNLRAR